MILRYLFMESKKKVFIIAAEPSADLIGYEIISSFNKLKNKYEFHGIGGDKMASLGFESLIDIKLLSVNGIVEVLMQILSLINILKKAERYIRQLKPNIIITIDAPSFNYRLIKRLQDLRNNSMFVHFVAPTVWAWKEKRARQFGKKYDLLLTLFKFEPKFFHPFNKNTFCIGHPIFFKKEIIKNKQNEKLITIFPGSRKNEIKYILPKILKSVYLFKKKYSGYEFIILSIPSLRNDIEKILKRKKCLIKVVCEIERKNLLLYKSFFSVAASGTVVLEIAKANVPMIVVYDSNFITSLFVKKMVKVKWANIINIIFDAHVVPEFLFDKFTPKLVFEEMQKLVENKNEIERQLLVFKKLKKELTIKNVDPTQIAVRKIIQMYDKLYFTRKKRSTLC